MYSPNISAESRLFQGCGSGMSTFQIIRTFFLTLFPFLFCFFLCLSCFLFYSSCFTFCFSRNSFFRLLLGQQQTKKPIQGFFLHSVPPSPSPTLLGFCHASLPQKKPRGAEKFSVSFLPQRSPTDSSTISPSLSGTCRRFLAPARAQLLSCPSLCALLS